MNKYYTIYTRENKGIVSTVIDDDSCAERTNERTKVKSPLEKTSAHKQNQTRNTFVSFVHVLPLMCFNF